MSQYTQFFIRHKDNFLPIATYSGSTKIAELFQYTAPYEAIKPVTSDMLRERRAEAQEQIDGYNKSIARAKNQIDFLRSCTMETDERLERYNDMTEYIEDLEEYKEECVRAISFIDFLNDILEEARMEKAWGENPLQLDDEDYVYVGIEVGTPTVENIID